MQIWGVMFCLFKSVKLIKDNKYKFSHLILIMFGMCWFDPETVDGVLEEVVDDLDQVVDPLMSMDRSENKTYLFIILPVIS